MARQSFGGSASQEFGGSWTERKLGILKEYLVAYNTALKNQPFSREYIDAFAGTGYREERCEAPDGVPLFLELAQPDVRQFLDGSARIALDVEPAFTRFTFIEKDARKVDDLRSLEREHPGKDIRIEQGDANEWVQRICRESWNMRRAVLFLDPYGMQVSWRTLEAVAATKSIDVWILFPLCAGVTRLLSKEEIPDEARCRPLDSLFGDRSWLDELYVKPANVRGGLKQESLFDVQPDTLEVVRRLDLYAIEKYYRLRLRTIFAGVADHAAQLKNSKNTPLYLLFFAAGNRKGAPIAVKIAQSIIIKRI